MPLSLPSLHFMVINIGYAQIGHPWGYRDLSSPFVRLFYVVHGFATLHLPSGDVAMSPGHMYLVPTFVSHSYTCQPGCGFYYLFIIEPHNDADSIFAHRRFPIVVNANEGADLLFRHFCQLYPRLSLPSSDAQAFDQHQSYRNYAQAFAALDDFEHLQLHGLVMILISYFMKHAEARHEADDPRLLRAVKFIQQHLGETINLDNLANLTCVSRSQLARLFVKAFGLSPLQYVLRQKVRFAQTLLLTTDLTVQQIAHDVGFDDASYFIRLYRKTIGMTPQDYRDKFR